MNVLIQWSKIQDFVTEVEVDDQDFLIWLNSSGDMFERVSDIPNSQLVALVQSYLKSGPPDTWYDQCSEVNDNIGSGDVKLEGVDQVTP